jgi:methyltransferase OMS1
LQTAAQVLRQACRLLKPGGKLLLLEHGKSSWSWLNSHMDERAAGHYKQYGCWYNRDILDIVRQVQPLSAVAVLLLPFFLSIVYDAY